MKKIFLLMAAAAMALGANAQVLKSDFFAGYSVGDKLDKGIYTEKDQAIMADQWNQAFSSSEMTAPGCTVGEGLSYPGYDEGGLSAQFGGFEDGEKGAHTSVYSLTKGKEYCKGCYYLTMVVNFSKIGKGDFVGLAASYNGGGIRANVSAIKAGKSGIQFGMGFLKLKTQGTEVFDYNKPHLLVLKLDYDAQIVSLYVDPDLSAGEPEEPYVKIEADIENELKHPIRGVTLRNRPGYKGNIGSMRWCDSWDGVTAK